MNDFLQRVANRRGIAELLRPHLHHLPRMGRVLAVGGVGFVIQTTTFELFGIWFGIVAPSTATLIGAEFAIISNFFLNQHFSFHDAAVSSSFYRRIIKFHLISSGSLATQWLFVFTAEHLTQNLFVLHGSYLSGVGLGFFLNYLGYYFFVWRRDKIQ